MEPLDEATDHVRGGAAGRLIIEYGDYECPYSRQAFREITRVERSLGEGVRFAFRHFPLTEIHPHALAASAAAEAAALQGRFWEMHQLLFHRQKALEDDDLRRYAAELELDVALFDGERAGAAVRGRVRRDVESGIESGEVQGTPTLFIDGMVHRGGTKPTW
jgi:protein-disulfide isomerase